MNPDAGGKLSMLPCGTEILLLAENHIHKHSLNQLQD
jgi:hypothetical protein